MDMEEIKVKIGPDDDLLLEHLRNDVSASGAELSSSEFEEKIKVDEIEVKMEPDGYPNNLPFEENGGTTDTSEFKIFKIPKTEVEEISHEFEILPDSESNCVEIKEEIEEKYTPPSAPDPVLLCNPILLSTKKKKKKAAQLVKCTECAMEFPKNTNLQKHMRAAHKNKFQCSLCQKGYIDKARLHRHKLRVHNINDDKTEESNSKMPTAAKVAVAPEKLRCFKCDQTFTTSFRLQNHEYTAHPIKKEFKCSICDLKFSSENIQMLHEKFTHPAKIVIKTESMSPPSNLIQQDSSEKIEKDFQKQRDDISDSTSANVFHPSKGRQEDYFQCSHCPSSFRNIKGLKSHNRVHSEVYDSWSDEQEKPIIFNCSKCPETFVKISKFINHKKGHGDQHRCTICPGVFASKYYLKFHRRVAHPEFIGKVNYKSRTRPQMFTTRREARSLPCKFCPDVFKTQQARTIHKWNKHPERNSFKCSKCDLSFLTNQRLKNHMKKHEGEVRLIIKCRKCDITFLTLFEQARHKEEFHSQPAAQIKWKPKPSKKNLSFGKTYKRYVDRICCHLCSKVFLSQNSLIIHKSNMHSEKNKQITKGKQKESDLVEKSCARGGDLTTLLSVDSVQKAPISESVGRINPEEVFVMPDVDVKEEFILYQTEPEDPMLGI